MVRLASEDITFIVTLVVATIASLIVVAPERFKWSGTLLFAMIVVCAAAKMWPLTAVLVLARLALEVQRRVKARESFAAGAPFEQRDEPWNVEGVGSLVRRRATAPHGDVREAVDMSPPDLVAAAQTNAVPRSDRASS
jgi:hypothetical protein